MAAPGPHTGIPGPVHSSGYVSQASTMSNSSATASAAGAFGQGTAEFFLSNYRLGKTLGIGSFGKVKVAEHVLTGHKVRALIPLRGMSLVLPSTSALLQGYLRDRMMGCASVWDSRTPQVGSHACTAEVTPRHAALLSCRPDARGGELLSARTVGGITCLTFVPIQPSSKPFRTVTVQTGCHQDFEPQEDPGDGHGRESAARDQDPAAVHAPAHHPAV